MLQPIGGELLMRVAPEVKRTLCKFFLAGTCERGELCTWAHGEQELGEPIGGLFNEQDVFRDDGLHVGKVGLAGFAGDPTMGPNAKRTICKFWEQGICKRGLECTFAHGVEDMQVDVQENLFEDLAPAQLPGSPSAGTKRTICKFWEEGACTKGEACTFAHGPEEIGAPIPVAFEPVLQGLGAPVGLGAIGKAPPIVSTAPVVSVHVKRTICKFWEQGTCTRGGECTWAHGEEELGAPVVMEPMEKSRPVPKQMQPIFSANVPATTGYVPAGKSGKGVIGKSVHGQKTVFQASPIERFDDHRFMPFEAPKGKGHQGKGKDIGSPLGSPLGSPIGFPGGKGAEQPLKKTICKFWLEGQCTRGQDCTWAHGVEDQAVPDHVALVGIPSGPPMAMGPTEVRRTICKFWQQGKCTQAAGQCTWAHGEWEIGTPVGAVSNKGGYQGGSVFKRPRLVH